MDDITPLKDEYSEEEVYPSLLLSLLISSHLITRCQIANTNKALAVVLLRVRLITPLSESSSSLHSSPLSRSVAHSLDP
jgi:hypothetical protein